MLPNISAQGPLSKEQQIEEILKCGKDPAYFIKNYAVIRHPTRGLLPFKTYPFQDDCIKAFEEHRLNIILKSRQLGLSTVTAAYAVWYAIFKRDKNILIIATKLSTAINFIKKCKVVLDNLPPWIMLTKFEPTKQSIAFTNGSNITAIPTSPDAGRSEALSLLIIDEAAFIKDFDEIWTGLSPTISTGGNAIIISTPNGVGGTYHKLWVDAEAKNNEFNTIELPWTVHPEHTKAWFDKETRALTKKDIAQEFLCSFASSGDTFLSSEDLEYLGIMVQPPKRKEGMGSNVWIWEDPEPDEKYVISADVSRGDSIDYSAFHIIKMSSAEVVGEYMGKVAPNVLADLLSTYGQRYNTALIVPERNTFGYFVCTKLRDTGYKRLYYKSSKGQDPYDYVPDPNKNELPGFDTQSNTRPQILTKLEELLRTKTISVRSKRFYEQILTFVWVNDRAQAGPGAHDDLVMSLAIGTWMIKGVELNSISTNNDITKALLGASTIQSTRLINPVGSMINNGTLSNSRNDSYKPVRNQNDYSNYDWLL